MASRSPKRETRKSKGKGGGLAGCRKERVPHSDAAATEASVIAVFVPRDGAWSSSRSSVVPASSPPPGFSAPFLPPRLPPPCPPAPPLPALSAPIHTLNAHTHNTSHAYLSLTSLTSLTFLRLSLPRPHASTLPISVSLNLPHVASSRFCRLCNVVDRRSAHRRL